MKTTVILDTNFPSYTQACFVQNTCQCLGSAREADIFLVDYKKDMVSKIKFDCYDHAFS